MCQRKFLLLAHCSCKIVALLTEVLLQIADDIQEIFSKEDLKCNASLFKGKRKFVEKLIKPATDIVMSSTSCEIAASTSDASSPGTGST